MVLPSLKSDREKETTTDRPTRTGSCDHGRLGFCCGFSFLWMPNKSAERPIESNRIQPNSTESTHPSNGKLITRKGHGWMLVEVWFVFFCSSTQKPPTHTCNHKYNARWLLKSHRGILTKDDVFSWRQKKSLSAVGREQMLVSTQRMIGMDTHTRKRKAQ